MSYRVSIQAQFDLDDIFELGAAGFGNVRAEKYLRSMQNAFSLLGDYPKLAQERPEFQSGMRIYPVGVHVVVYLVDEDGVLIVRVRHGHEDWMNDPA